MSVITAGITYIERDGVRATLIKRDMRDPGDRDLIEFSFNGVKTLVCAWSYSIDGMDSEAYLTGKLGIDCSEICKAARDQWRDQIEFPQMG